MVYDHEVGEFVDISVICTGLMVPEQTGFGLIEKLATGTCPKTVELNMKLKATIVFCNCFFMFRFCLGLTRWMHSNELLFILMIGMHPTGLILYRLLSLSKYY